MGVNRANKYKDRRSSGCAMCKPYKHGWESKFKIKVKSRLQDEDFMADEFLRNESREKVNS